MTDVVVERTLDPALRAPQFPGLVEASAECMSLYAVQWVESFLSSDGRSLVCHFQAPDTENTRTAIRQTGSDMDAAWPASLHDGAVSDLVPNVLVSRRFEAAVEVEDIQAIEDAGSNCLSLRGVTFVKTLFSTDRKRMICLYHAPDAEAVRAAQREAGVPFEDAWACHRLNPQAMG